jgi:hypothetical protein
MGQSVGPSNFWKKITNYGQEKGFYFGFKGNIPVLVVILRGFNFVIIWIILEGNTVTPNQSLKQLCYDEQCYTLHPMEQGCTILICGAPC